MPSVKIKRTSKNGGIKGLGIASKHLDKVGVFCGHDRTSGRYPKNGPAVAQVGRWNAKGTDKIPARDYLGKLVQQYRKKYKRAMAALAKNMLLGRLDKGKANRNMGLRGVKEFKEIIVAWKTPPNAKSTEKKKGFNNPLIHTKRLLRSVMWKASD